MGVSGRGTGDMAAFVVNWIKPAEEWREPFEQLECHKTAQRDFTGAPLPIALQLSEEHCQYLHSVRAHGISCGRGI